MTGATWRCQECDTYNDADAAQCMTCASAKRPASASPSPSAPALTPTPVRRPVYTTPYDWLCTGCGSVNRLDVGFVCPACREVMPMAELGRLLGAAPAME